MKSYEKPTMEIVKFQQDIITASGDDIKVCDKICQEITVCEVKVCQEIGFCDEVKVCQK